MHSQHLTGPERPGPNNAGPDDTAEYELIALRSHRRFPPETCVPISGECEKSSARGFRP